MDKYTHDVIVIGAGSGGLNIAMFMIRAGFKVLLIDKSDKDIGGDCLNYGCVPSKALIHVARKIASSREVKEFGVNAFGDVDIKKVMSYVKSKQEVIRKHENAAYFRKKGINVELGKFKFIAKDELIINDSVYSAKKIIIATGSRPRIPQIEGIEKVKYLTNENIFDLKKLPKELVVIGGGPIGIELGQAFSMFGSNVHIIQREDKLLPKESKDVTDVLLEQLKKQGIKFYFDSEPVKFLSTESVLIKDKKGKTKTLSFDNVLISVGRELNIEDMDLGRAGVIRDDRRIFIDDYLRTTNKNILLCGDVAGGYQFTHAAELHAGVIIKNLFSPFKSKVDYRNLSWVTYTTPEIATFGRSEDEIKKRGISYEKLVYDFSDDDRSIVTEKTYGKSVLYVHKNRILGGTMVADNAGEIFQELVLARSAKLGINDIFSKIYPYPTASRVNKRIVGNRMSKKLTPVVKKIMRMLY